MGRKPILSTGALPAKVRQRRRRARQRMEALMAVSRADVALAEARSLIENRAAWPDAPLVGAGDVWLRPGQIAAMAGEFADSEAAMVPVRQAVRPMGVLDALEVVFQHAGYIDAAAEKLRSLGQNDAATVLQAEAADPANASWYEVRNQFLKTARARIRAERPKIPVWIGPPDQGAQVLATFGEPDEDELDGMTLVELSDRLDRLELGRAMAEARVRWSQSFDYPPADTIIERSAFEAYGRLWHAAKVAFDRQPAPEQWPGTQVPRRIMDRIAIGNPQLAAEMMTRVPAATVVDTGEGAVQPSAIEELLQ